MSCLITASDKLRSAVYISSAVFVLLSSGCATQPELVSQSNPPFSPAPKQEEALFAVGSVTNMIVAEPKPASQRYTTPEVEVGTPIELNTSNFITE
jgi:hypothetical protein